MEQRKWWKEAVGYQIYPKSFYDTNGDGIGDLKGIIKKLDYLDYLGINLIWICPFYKSPMDDNGYDISDFYSVNPEFGTIEDFKILIKKAHDKGIKVIIDLVLNHTSDEHPWFIESKKSLKNKKRNYYIWRQGKQDEFGNEVEPNNWKSFFGGSCWKKDSITGEYYMKIFSDKMPDLNWENDEVRNELYQMSNWWLDLGVDGFRVDAVSHIARHQLDKNVPTTKKEKYVDAHLNFSNLPKVHNYLKEFHEKVLQNKNTVTIGEVGGNPTIDDALKYAGYKSKELDMVFNFKHNWCNNAFDIHKNEILKTDLIKLKEALVMWQEGLYEKAWNPLYWFNHDHPRALSQYGSEIKRYESATMMATALYNMWGTPFIYNGEEIGMSNYPFTKIEEFKDVSAITKYKEVKNNSQMSEEELIKEISLTSREHSRIPMQWNKSQNAGFTTGVPWMDVHPNHQNVNVEIQQNDPNSILNYYRKIIALRKNGKYKNTLVYGKFKHILENDEHIFAYIRETKQHKILVITNFFNKEIKTSLHGKAKKIILSNYKQNTIDLDNIVLQPYQAIIYEL